MCEWCANEIQIHTLYSYWVNFDCGEVVTVRLHPECVTAMKSDDSFEFSAGDNPRGCNCGFAKDCEKCKETRDID